MKSLSMFTKFQRQLIESCPASGAGVHQWTFKVLLILSKIYLANDKLFYAAKAIFSEFASRQVNDGEILRQIDNARRYTSGNNCDISLIPRGGMSPSWPTPDLRTIESIVRSGPGLTKLRQESPIDVEGQDLKCLPVLELLFPGDPLLCCAKELWNAGTMRLSHWSDLDNHQFIVPSPMRSERGQRLSGGCSARCLENTGERHYLVVEFDFQAGDAGRDEFEGDSSGVSSDPKVSSKCMVSRLILDGFSVQDICASLIHHLATYVCPVLVVHSGGKSLHGWFPCAGIEENILQRFMRYAVQIGADRATWTRCQFVRMPAGLRDNGKRQKVVYFNPEALL